VGRPDKAKRAAIVQRRADAIELRLAGVDWLTIARKLAADPAVNCDRIAYPQGYGCERYARSQQPPADDQLINYVCRDVRAALKERAAEHDEKADELRAVENERLDKLFFGLVVPLSDAQWARIEPLLPDRLPRRGGQWRDHREVIDAIAWKFQTGSQWVHLPADRRAGIGVNISRSRRGAGRSTGRPARQLLTKCSDRSPAADEFSREEEHPDGDEQPAKLDRAQSDGCCVDQQHHEHARQRRLEARCRRSGLTNGPDQHGLPFSLSRGPGHTHGVPPHSVGVVRPSPPSSAVRSGRG